MKLSSTFDPLQQVWPIGRGSVSEFIPCSFCGQTGKLKGEDGEVVPCPKCHGRRGKDQFKKLAWKVGSPLTVGQITLRYRAEQPGIPGEEQFDNMGPQQESLEEDYMCIETGIGSGAVHRKNSLFASYKEAEEECQRLNKEGE